MSVRNGVLVVRRGRGRPGFIFLGVFVLPVLAWLGYNYFDRPLLPGAQAVLAAPAETVPAEQNLYLAMLALPIAGDEAAHERGTAALAAYQARIKSGVQPKTFAEALERPIAVFDEGGVQLCSAGNQQGAYDCLRSSVAQRAQIEALAAKYWPLLQRYEALAAYPRYSDPLTPTVDAPVANATSFMVSLLELAMLALAAADGAANEAAASLARSAAIWRVVLAARDATIIDKMMANRALSAHSLLASELLRSFPLNEQALAQIEALLAPLQDAERSLAGALAKEFRMQAASWTAMLYPTSEMARSDFAGTPPWWFRVLAKVNATINLSYTDFERVLAVEQQGCVGVKRAFDAVSAMPAPTALDLPWYGYFYNPVGRILHTTSGGADIYLEYLGRQCNLLALQGMVALQAELRRAGLGPDALPGAVEASRFRDPNSGKAYRYDVAARALAFEVIGKQPEHLSPLPLTAP